MINSDLMKISLAVRKGGLIFFNKFEFFSENFVKTSNSTHILYIEIIKFDLPYDIGYSE